jgi:hypothetical protein
MIREIAADDRTRCVIRDGLIVETRPYYFDIATLAAR